MVLLMLVGCAPVVAFWASYVMYALGFGPQVQGVSHAEAAGAMVLESVVSGESGWVDVAALQVGACWITVGFTVWRLFLEWWELRQLSRAG